MLYQSHRHQPPGRDEIKIQKVLHILHAPVIAFKLGRMFPHAINISVTQMFVSEQYFCEIKLTQTLGSNA